MKKTKKVQLALPKNLQLTLITLGAIAFVAQAMSYITLMLRVYPDGIRFSQFTLMSTSYMLLPVILFAIAYFTERKGSARFDRVFYALLLTILGLGIHTIVSVIDRILSQFTDLHRHDLFINGGMILLPIAITLALFAGLLYLLTTHSKTADTKLRLSLIVVLGLAYIADAIFNLSSLVLRHIGSKDIMNFITHPDFITQVVLPLAFFATAYLTLRRMAAIERIYSALLYATAGYLVILITLSLFHTYTTLFAQASAATIYALNLPTIFATTIGITVYAFLIITHNRAKKLTKKTK